MNEMKTIKSDVSPLTSIDLFDGGSGEHQTTAKIWYEIRNMEGHNLAWEWMEQAKDGEYLLRKDVLGIIERHLKP